MSEPKKFFGDEDDLDTVRRKVCDLNLTNGAIEAATRKMASLQADLANLHSTYFNQERRLAALLFEAGHDIGEKVIIDDVVFELVEENEIDFARFVGPAPDEDDEVLPSEKDEWNAQYLQSI